MRIGIDIDGVIYPWADAANEAVVEKFGVPNPGDHTCWNHLRDCLTADQWQWVWSEDGISHVFGRFDLVYPGVQNVIEQLLIAPCVEVHFVTHRNPCQLGSLTARYLAWIFPGHQYEGLHVTKGTDKSELLGWDAFIDDKPETVKGLLERCPRVFMPRRPWNETVEDQRVLAYENPAQLLEVLA